MTQIAPIGTPIETMAETVPDDLVDPRSQTERRMAGALQALLPADATPLCLPLAVLWARFLRHDAADPVWPDRDRLVVPDSLATISPTLLDLTGQEVAGWGTPNGLAQAAGMALAERALTARFGRSLVDHRVWVLATEADLAKGGAQEAILQAGQQRLERLAVISAGGDDAVARRFTACGWIARRCAATPEAVAAALSACLRARKPMLLLCDPPAPAEPDSESGRLWRAAAVRGSRIRRAWLRRLTRHPLRAEYERVQTARLPESWPETLAARPAVETALAALPELAGSDEAAPIATPWSLNGMAQHGGVLPLAWIEDADTALPALRQAAKLGLRVIHMLRGAPSACLRAVPNLLLFEPGDMDEALSCLDLALRRADGPSVIALPPALPATLDERPVLRAEIARGGYVLAEAPGPRHATLVAAGRALAPALAAQALLARENIGLAVVALPCWALFAAQDPAWRETVLGMVLGDAPRFGVEFACGLGWERWLGVDAAMRLIGLTASGLPGDDETTTEAIATTIAPMIAQTIRKHLQQEETR